MSNNHTEEMTSTMHEFFYTVGVATTTGIAYYIWTNLYPITLDRLLADTAWYSIRVQTQLEMAASKIEEFLNPWLTTVVPEKEKHDVIFYYNGVKIASMSYLDALKYEDDDFAQDYNKVSYEINDDKTNERLLMLRDSVDQIMDRGLKKSNVNFISVCLKREGKDDVEIDMTSKGNIYMVGNELFSKSFLEWLIPDLDLAEDYTISTIDDNVNMVSFTKNQYIILNDNGYDVKTIEEEDKSDLSEKVKKNNDNCYFSWFPNLIKAKDE